MRFKLLLSTALCSLMLGCASTGSTPVKDSSPSHVPIDPHSVPQPVPKQEPRSRYGNPKSYVVFGKRYHVLDSAEGYKERGIASWYGTKFHGKRTSSGEPYDMFALTAAHKSLPLPSYVRVQNLENGRSLIVKVNDRGPFHPGRIIDLSYTAAVQLGVYAQGFAQVEVTAIDSTTPVPDVPPQAPEPTAISATDASALDDLIAKLEAQTEPADDPSLPYLEIASFSASDQCQTLFSQLEERKLMALQVQSPPDTPASACRVLQGPFATARDAETQAQTLRELGYNPVVTYP